MRDKIRALVERTAARQSVLPDPRRAKRVFPPPPPRPVPDTGYSQALAGMADLAFCKSVKYGDMQRRADRIEAHPRILEFEAGLIKRLRSYGVPLYAHCVWRDKAEQERVNRAGNSKASFGRSPHNWGCAVDIVHCRHHWNLTERQWAVIGHIGKEYGLQAGLHITWGGEWDFYDPAHWELSDWRGCRIARYEELAAFEPEERL